MAELTKDPMVFARVAVEAMQDIVSVTSVDRFFSNLQASLVLAADRIKSLKKKDDRECLKRVSNLLIVLEKICKFPSPFRRPRDPTDLSQYKHLNRFVQGKRPKKWLRRLSKTQNKRKRHTFIDELDTCLATEQTRGDFDFELDLDLNNTDTKRPDCHIYVKNLYGIMHPLCFCSVEQQVERITANLHLRWCSSPDSSQEEMDFRMFLLEHPHHDKGRGPPRWKDVQIRIPRNNRKKKRVRIAGAESQPVSASTRQIGETVVSAGNFCNVISNKLRSKLQMTALRDGSPVLQKSQQPHPHDNFSLDKLSISLAELLQFFTELDISQKVLLSYAIAKAFWLFYDSEWMRYPWTKEDIHFMVERYTVNEGTTESVRGIFISDPFLSTRFEYENQNPYTELHPFPKILALGIMFLEIALGEGLENHWKPEHLDQNHQPIVDADYFTAQRVFLETNKGHGSVAVLKGFIKRCIGNVHFSGYQHNEGAGELRDAIQKDIVNVLYSIYQEYDLDPDTHRTGKISLLRMNGSSLAKEKSNRVSTSLSLDLMSSPLQRQSNYSNTRRLGIPMTGEFESESVSWFQSGQTVSQLSSSAGDHQPLSHSHPRNGIMSNEVTDSNEWFRRFEILGRVLRQRPHDRACPAVKITILDTGVSHNFNGIVKRYEDFLSPSNAAYQDVTGHGTEAVSLITTVYPAAEIYVGRVFKTPYADENTAALIAKAILRAVHEWKTDIMVLASGFEKHDEDLDQAIEAASRAGKLIFAAASNYGNAMGIAFPARKYPYWKLLCMFATTPGIRATCGFNPTPSGRAIYNFAILGEDVEIPSTKKVQSGTSYSTMIGAGLAGLILEFARHESAEGRGHRLERLSTVEGMSAVFAAMAKDKGNGYDCIAPWKILSEDVRDECADKVTARKDVLDKIIAALRDCY